MTDPTEPTGPAYPTLVLQILAQHPTIRPTTDPDCLIGRMLTQGDLTCQPRSN